MGKKLAQSMLLMTVVAVMVIGGGMVQEGRHEMGLDVTSGFSLASDHSSAKDSTENKILQITDMISDEMFIRTNACPQAHRDF
jgi:hypothetical protein